MCYWRYDARRRRREEGGWMTLCRAVVRCAVLRCVSPWLPGCLCVSLSTSLSCVVMRCAVPRRARGRACASACFVYHCHFSSVCSCLPPCLLWSACLPFEAFDVPQWFHVISFSYLVPSTFPDRKPHLFCKRGVAVSLEKCLKQLREATNMKPL